MTWDDRLREAYALGEVIVYRGEYPAVEIDVVTLDNGVDDPYGDACRRAFPDEDTAPSGRGASRLER